MRAGLRWKIPAEVRAQPGMPEGGAFLVHVENGQIRLEPIQTAIARAQAIVRRHVPEGVSHVDELSAERRAEVA